MKSHIFGLLFKTIFFKTNSYIDMNFRTFEAQNPKFSKYVRSSAISWVVNAIIKCENRMSVVEICQSDLDDSPLYFVLSVNYICKIYLFIYS